LDMTEGPRSAISSLVPRPKPLTHGYPKGRRTALFVISGIGTVLMIALLAAALAPSPGQPYRPIGAVAGFAGLVVFGWIALYAAKMPIRDSVADRASYELHRRQAARNLLLTRPTLAVELGIGRPELGRGYDDGGLIDVNHVPLSVFSALPGMNPGLPERVMSVRDKINGFDSYDDLLNFVGLSPETLEPWSDRFIFIR
jgi:DNA uptake protein ComE-like DNA-binding protein